MEGVAAVAVAKRGDIMANIESRVNSGSYTRKNEKDVREKVRFFQKKEAGGVLPKYMEPRYVRAKALMAKIDALKSGNPLPKANGSPKVEASPKANGSLKAEASPKANGSPKANESPKANAAANALSKLTLSEPVMRLKKSRTSKKRVTIAPKPAPGSPVGFNPPAPSPKPQQPTFGEYSPGGTYHAKGQVSPASPSNSPQRSPRQFLQLMTTAKSRVRKTAGRTRRRLTYNPENIKYMELASKDVEVPKLYDPFTGDKIPDEEDPMEKIGKAHKMLEDLLADTIEKAYKLKKASLKRASRSKPKATV